MTTAQTPAQNTARDTARTPRTTALRRRSMRATALGLPLLLLTGCGFKGAQSFPLPGGEATGSDAYEVTLEFSDVLDLVPQSSVKVNDVSVGSVSDIELRDFTAVVTVRVRNDVTLPENTRGMLRQTSLLGEKFVSLEAPEADEAVGRLKDGDVIPIANTTRNAEIEEVLSALSLVLNGGSLEQLRVINREVILALKGREGDVKDLLKQLNRFVGGLDDQKADIVRALDSLDRLTLRLARERGVLATALDDLPDGAKVLADQREQLTKMVQGLSRLGGVSQRVIRASQQNTVADLKALDPILSGLNDAGTALPRGLELLATYPFPQTVSRGIRGDYANLFVTLDASSLFRNPSQLDDLGLPSAAAAARKAAAQRKSANKSDGTPQVEVPTLPGVPKVDVPAVEVPEVPGVDVPAIDVPDLPGGGAGAGSGSTGTDPGTTDPGASDDTSLTELLLGGMQ